MPEAELTSVPASAPHQFLVGRLYLTTCLSLAITAHRLANQPKERGGKKKTRGRRALELVKYVVAIIMALDYLGASVKPPASFRRRFLTSGLDHALAPLSASVESAGKSAGTRF
jgi:hypothetical protein